MLVLVVGPSGAGKDTLLRGARDALAADSRFSFVRRVITRDALPDAEDHETMTPAAFAAADAAGAFALRWDAHGLSYGVPATAIPARGSAQVAVVNGSRAALPSALARFPDAQVVLITATPAERAKRLAQRGRESAEEIAARIARETPAVPQGAVVIDNSGTPEAGISAFVAALQALALPATV